jgi:hypothetical protein
MNVSRTPFTDAPVMNTRGPGLLRLARIMLRLVRRPGPAPRMRRVARADLVRGAGRTP